MILFACDWCQTVKQPGECWILGMGVEQVAFAAARREIDILATWDDARAVHPLAVHFCCEAHKDNYIAVLFRPVSVTAPVQDEVLIQTKVQSRPARTAPRMVETKPTRAKPNKSAARKRRSSRRRAA